MHQAYVNGTEYEFAWPKDMVLLEAMEAAGIPANYSCRKGECGSCQVYIEGGASHMRPHDYKPGEGITLACQTLRDDEGPFDVESVF